MSLLTAIPAIPTIHNGVPVDPKQLKAAIDYLSSVYGPTMTRVKWVSPKKTLAAYKTDEVESHGEAVAGIGMEYKNLPQNVDRVTGPLPWGEWLLYPWVIIHNGNLYVRVYPVKDTLKMTYRKNGEVITHTEYKNLVPKRKPSTDTTLTQNIRVDRLTLLS